MGSVNSVRFKDQDNFKDYKVVVFLEKHPTLRKTMAYAPSVILGGCSLIEQFTSYKLLPSATVPNVAAIFSLCAICGIVAGIDGHLENKKIERLS